MERYRCGVVPIDGGNDRRGIAVCGQESRCLTKRVSAHQLLAFTTGDGNEGSPAEIVFVLVAKSYDDFLFRCDFFCCGSLLELRHRKCPTSNWPFN